MDLPLHPTEIANLPVFITKPGQTDLLLVITSVVLVLLLLTVGNLYLRLHTLPERMAHRSRKLQFELVAILGILALFTHNHLFWVAGLLLAFIEFPDFSTPIGRIAGALEKMAGIRRVADDDAVEDREPDPDQQITDETDPPRGRAV